MAVYLLHFSRVYEPYPGAPPGSCAGHYIGSARNVTARLAQHAAGRGARLLAVAQAAGITWELARVWPGGRARERAIKRQGSARRCCPLCGVQPRGALPRNRDGSVSRSLTTDAQKLAAGLMTAAQLAEHTALRRGTVTGKLPRRAERGPLLADLWACQPASRPSPAPIERDGQTAAIVMPYQHAVPKRHVAQPGGQLGLAPREAARPGSDPVVSAAGRRPLAPGLIQVRLSAGHLPAGLIHPGARLPEPVTGLIQHCPRLDTRVLGRGQPAPHLG